MKRRFVTIAPIAIMCGGWLSGGSSAVAQTASASPQAAESPRLDSSGVGVPEWPRFQIVPKFLAGIPIGSFGRRVGVSPGAAVDFAARAGRAPVSVGGTVDYVLYGTETRRIALFPEVPEVLSDVNTYYNLLRAHALVRVQPRTGRVRPYAEGLVGFGYVWTRTSIDLADDDGNASTTHLGEFAPSLGAGGGVTIGLWEQRDARLGLDIGLRYLTGSEVNYLTPGDLKRDETGVTFEPTRSTASLFGVQIGVSFEF